MKKGIEMVICYSLLICSLIFLSDYSVAGGTNLIIKFGQMEESSSGYYVAKETTIIPLKLRDTGFKFGFSVQSSDNASFNGYKIIYMPAIPKTIGPGIKEKNVSYEGTVIKGKEERYDGMWWEFFVFDEGDPLGKWKLEIYINGKLAKTINFKVVPIN